MNLEKYYCRSWESGFVAPRYCFGRRKGSNMISGGCKRHDMLVLHLLVHNDNTTDFHQQVLIVSESTLPAMPLTIIVMRFVQS